MISALIVVVAAFMLIGATNSVPTKSPEVQRNEILAALVAAVLAVAVK